MKKSLILWTSLCLSLAACQDIEKEAAVRLDKARQAFETGLYNEAKQEIDSIKILYPKAFDTRRAGLYLLQDIELAEQQRTLAYLDSCLQEEQKRLTELTPRFVLEKDTAYQQTGRYLAPSQVIEKNLHRSFLRFQTDENGKLSLTSIYCGNTPVHHTAVKVTAPDGTFAQTPTSKDSYETKDLGVTIEKADYRQGEDGDVISFVALHADQNLRVDYLGDRTYTTALTRADRQAAASVSTLSQVLSSITQIKAQTEEAHQKIRFIQENIKKRKTKEEE